MKKGNIKKMVEALNLQMATENTNFHALDKMLDVLSEESGYEFRIVNRRIMYKEHGMLHDAYADL